MTGPQSSKNQLKRYDMWMAEDGINPRESSRGAYVLAHEALAEIERLSAEVIYAYEAGWRLYPDWMMQAASAALDLIESDFGQSGSDVKAEVLRCLIWDAYERDRRLPSKISDSIFDRYPPGTLFQKTEAGTIVGMLPDGTRVTVETVALHDWLEFDRAPAAQCRRCKAVTWENPPPAGPCSAVETTTCRIYEYDGAYKCYSHGRQWGAISPVTGPCPGWQPLKTE